MRYRYDPRVAVAGLVIGAVLLVGGLLTGNKEAGGAVALAAIITSTMVAYVRVPDRPGDEPADRR